MAKELLENYELICEGCGKKLDMRNPSILVHGWIEEGKIVCFDEVDLPYSSSKRVGESTEWTKDLKPIALN